MKRLLLILLAVVFAIGTEAQTSREWIDKYPHIATMTQSVYAGHYFYRPIAEAPKGYKPFYISHYGRHGSRGESNIKYPKLIVRIFEVADSLNLLTAKGKEVKALAYKIHDTQEHTIGELTRVGFEQHKGLARRMYQRFKPVFDKGSIIDSRTSTYTRCIMSMVAFNESLKECEPMIETRMVASAADRHIIRPSMPFVKSEYYKNRKFAWKDTLEAWKKSISFSNSLNAMFTDYKPLLSLLDMDETELAVNIYKRIAFMQNYGWAETPLLAEIYSGDERYNIFLYDNYRWFCQCVSINTEDGITRFAPMKALLEDIVKYGDLAVAGKNSASANLRFGHDYFLLGMLSVLNFNELPCGHDISSVEKLGAEWPLFKCTTMASSLQIVFYNSKKSDDVLVRFLENENDVTLPIKSETAPFYKWEDVRNYIKERVALIAPAK